jgi:Predicted membrane protein
MEIIAVKADDGTIRTSLNTCQVCWDSGRGYYKQQGNELVCQNCGNRFDINQIEKIKNGCNPVPITSDLKTENSDQIAITGDALATFAHFFQK